MQSARNLPLFNKRVEDMTMDTAAVTAEISSASGDKSPELTWRNWVNLAAYIANFATTGASSFGLFGPDNTELSKKYQTLVTPAGAAFAIWGAIFLLQLAFAVCQMLPSFRGNSLVQVVMPGWAAACAFQSIWNIAFAQEWIGAALVLMYGILLGLVIIRVCTDGMAMTWGEYAVFRLPFSLHLGWILAASQVNTSVYMDFLKSSPEVMLSTAVTSVGVICVAGAIFSLAMKTAEPVVCFVAAWAFNFIRVELSDPEFLDDATRHNPHTWDRVTLNGLKMGASNISVLALALALVAIARASWPRVQGTAASSKSVDLSQELTTSAQA